VSDQVDRQFARVVAALAGVSPEAPPFPAAREKRRSFLRGKPAWVFGVSFVAVLVVGAGLLGIQRVLGPGDSSGAEATATSPTAIADLSESLVESGSGWEFYISQAEGAVCYRIVSLSPGAGDTGDCRPPGEWSIPNVLHWGATWGTGDSAEIYGIATVAVARIEIEFVHGPPAIVRLFESSTDTGFSGFYYQHNPDADGIFTVISAYDSGGALLGQYDARDECPVLIQASSDERLLEMCGEPAE